MGLSIYKSFGKKFSVYFLFVLVASSVNFLTQELIYFLVANIYISIFFGLATSMVVKYLTNKKYVFRYRAASRTDEVVVFFRYALSGAVVAGLFIGIELSFYYYLDSLYRRQIGIVVALCVTALIKFVIDERWVFPKT